MKFSEKLKLARIESGLSQEELAQKVSLSRRMIIFYENGEKYPRTKATFEKLAEAMNLPADYFIDDETLFISESTGIYGYRGGKQARELVSEISGLFAGGEMAEEDMDAMMSAIMAAYKIAKSNNQKYVPKKYKKEEE